MKIVRTGAEEIIDSVDLIQNLCADQGIYLAQHPQNNSNLVHQRSINQSINQSLFS